VGKTKTYGGFLISRIKYLQRRVFEKILRESKIDAFNGAQGRILYVLWEHEKLTIGEISRLTSLAKSTLTSMIDRMEEGGLVKRIPDEENRRQIFVTITSKAKSYREIYNQVSDRMSEIFYKGFTDAEIADFEDKLKRIIENLESV